MKTEDIQPRRDGPPPLNRAQRRAALFGRGRPLRQRDGGAAGALTPLYILDNARPHEPGEKAGAHVKTRTCLQRLQDGSGSSDDHDHVAMVLNICRVRALDIDATLADMIDRAMDAMQRCAGIHTRHGRYGFDGPGLHQVLQAIDAAESIIDASTPLQMRAARRRVVDELLGRGAWRRMEMEVRS